MAHRDIQILGGLIALAGLVWTVYAFANQTVLRCVTTNFCVQVQNTSPFVVLTFPFATLIFGISVVVAARLLSKDSRITLSEEQPTRASS